LQGAQDGFLGDIVNVVRRRRNPPEKGSEDRLAVAECGENAASGPPFSIALSIYVRHLSSQAVD
jgi:hypothetical protein